MRRVHGIRRGTREFAGLLAVEAAIQIVVTNPPAPPQSRFGSRRRQIASDSRERRPVDGLAPGQVDLNMSQ
jgi:hypothetical protein